VDKKDPRGKEMELGQYSATLGFINAKKKGEGLTRGVRIRGKEGRSLREGGGDHRQPRFRLRRKLIIHRREVS